MINIHSHTPYQSVGCTAENGTGAAQGSWSQSNGQQGGWDQSNAQMNGGGSAQGGWDQSNAQMNGNGSTQGAWSQSNAQGNGNGSTQGAWSQSNGQMNGSGSAQGAWSQSNGQQGMTGGATMMEVAPSGSPNGAATYYPEAADGLTSVPPDLFDDHLSADEAAQHSWRALLARNVGRNVIANFLLGTQNTVSVEGQLYEVGSDYLVIYQPAWDSHITADLYSVKFVEFREPPNGD